MFIVFGSVFLGGLTIGLLDIFSWIVIVVVLFIFCLGNSIFKWKFLVFSIGLVIIFAIGIYRGENAFERETTVEKYINTSVEVTGTVAFEPRERFRTKDVVIEITKVCDENDCTNVSTRLLAKVSPLIQISLGDEVSMKGRLQIPEPFEGETGRVFRYDLFLAKDGIEYTLGRPTILSIKDVRVPTEFLFRFKWALVSKIDQLFPHPESALAAGILLGIGKDFDAGTEDMFRHLGLSHIIVLSGYNITLIAHLLLAILRGRVSWGALHLLIAIGMIIFCTMVGFTASVTRACLMALIMLLAKFIGQEALPMQALMATVIVLAFVSPLSLLYDPAFQLTGLATLGLLVFATPFDKLLQRIRIPGLFRETLAGTLAAQIAVLPVAMSLGSTLSFISLAANMLILPIIPYGMIGAFAVASFALIAEPIGQILLPLGYIPLRFVFILAGILERF